MVISHSTAHIANDVVASADWNANHTGDLDHGADLTNVTVDQHHAQSHNAVSHSDITATGAQIDAAHAHVNADGSSHADVATNTLKNTNVTTNLSLGVGNATTEVVACSDGTDCTLIEADTDNAGLLGADKWDEIVANTAAKHTQNTDTALGAGCVSDDHGAAATDQVINVCYGEGAPPAANTTTEGALFVQYTA